jgi:hypothetical protein
MDVSMDVATRVPQIIAIKSLFEFFFMINLLDNCIILVKKEPFR